VNDSFEKIMESINNSTFCFALESGESLTNINNCACGHTKSCQESRDKHRFYIRSLEFREESGEITDRAGMIKALKPEFKDSKWWKNNVIE
jgi:hypothetical protein